MTSLRNGMRPAGVLAVVLSWTVGGIPAPVKATPPAASTVQAAPSATRNADADSATPAGPRLHVDAPVFDFGHVEQGETVTHVFRFSNRGTRALRIESVETSCGCTAAVLADDTIAPGAAGSIRARFDTGRFLGAQSKRLNVRSNDPAHPITTLILQGEVTAEVAVQPQQLYLGRLRRGSRATRTVSVLYDADTPISITGIDHDHPGLRVETEDVEADGKRGRRVHVRVADTAPLGQLRDTLTITTTSEKKPRLTIPVFGNVEGDVAVEPPQVSFGVVRPGTRRTRIVRIKNTGAAPLRILEVTSSLDTLVPELHEVTPGREFRLDLHVRGDTPGRLRGKVEVVTDHPEQARLAIRVFGAVRDADAAGR